MSLACNKCSSLLSFNLGVVVRPEDLCRNRRNQVVRILTAGPRPFFSNQRARNQFRARPGKGGNTSYQLRQYAEATLGGGSLRKVVKLPDGEDENEWLAVNMVDFYNQINLLYGAITEFCSPQSCPEMKATDE